MNKNKILYTAGAILAALAIFFAAPLKTAFADTAVSWGVTPNSSERTPDAPAAGAKLLKEANGLFVGDTSQKRVYFTFDLGYEAGYTAEVLDILKQNGIKAIFFLCGNYLKERELIDRMITEGHSIGNHTDRHKDLPSLAREGVEKDIKDFNDKFKNIYNDVPVSFFRPPQGRFDKKVMDVVQRQGLKTVLWSIAIVDWGKKPIDSKASADKIAKRLHPGAVILSHITNSGTPQMLKLLLPQMAQKGYTAGNPSEL